MSTLLIRCAGPLQSWGTRSRFTERDTEREPSKSGVIGLVCAALGRDRSEPLDDLAALRMGVRVDREGVILRDFHTAERVIRASGALSADAVISNRYYLQDGVFLVGIEGDTGLLQQIDDALKAPVWPLFLGRKSCPPGGPVSLPGGFQPDAPLERALREYPRLSDSTDNERRRLVIECSDGESGDVRQDVPISFDLAGRHFATRRVRTDWVEPVK